MRVLLSLLLFGTLFSVALAQTSADVEARRAQLQVELEAEERQIADQTKLLESKQRERATVQGEVELLKSQIAGAKKRIEAKRVAITRLEADIVRRTSTIGVLDARIHKEQTSLAELLRKTRDVDTASIVELVLDSGSVSDFFNNTDDFAIIESALQESFARIRADQEATRREKLILEGKKVEELDAKQAIESERKVIEKREAERSQILALTRTQEKTYEQILAERRRRAGVIRSALFALRDTASIPFGRALEFANETRAKTGIRPALLLAILQQESNLGENIGTCNRPGDPPEKGWRNVMKPSRDHGPFLKLTSELGLNPDDMPVSCPWRGGWGGAMGPAQFIPSTWERFKSQIAAYLGKAVPNPWEPRDAFMASATYLSALGASAGAYSAEREAALRYYAGNNWQKPQNAFYGNQVMARAQDIEVNMILPLQNV